MTIDEALLKGQLFLHAALDFRYTRALSIHNKSNNAYKNCQCSAWNKGHRNKLAQILRLKRYHSIIVSWCYGVMVLSCAELVEIKGS